MKSEENKRKSTIKIYEYLYTLTNRDSTEAMGILLACLVHLIEEATGFPEDNKFEAAKVCCDIISTAFKQKEN